MIEYGNIDGMKAYLAETVVVGSGASGYNAACLLRKGFVDDLLVITDGRREGSSRNTGASRQSYYRLSSDGDSVLEMARDLFDGGALDGDVALAEASLSTQSFMRLSELGIPFPTSRYGESIGYSTGFDSRNRTTTIGPNTGKYMTDYLEYEANREGVDVLENHHLVRICQKHGIIKAIIVLDRETAERKIILTRNLVLATGGSCGIFSETATPSGLYGTLGLSIEAGVRCSNLTECQFGLTAIDPRMKMDGILMTSLPRFISIDGSGVEHEFLVEAGLGREDIEKLLILKGNEWAFDVRKTEGSSKLDILVLDEIRKGRKVYLDYMHSLKTGAETPASIIRRENYLLASYLSDRGADISRNYIEVTVGAEHFNGGIAVDSWWQSNVEGLFAIGEASSATGIYSPTGSSFNMGQVSARRASSWILEHGIGDWYVDPMNLEEDVKLVDSIADNAMEGSIDALSVLDEVRTLMSSSMGIVRNMEGLKVALVKVDGYLSNFDSIKVDRTSLIWMLFELRNVLLTAKAMLESAMDYMENGGKNRASALYEGRDVETEIPAIQEVILKDGALEISRRAPRPILTSDDPFDEIWKSYRRNKNVY